MVAVAQDDVVEAAPEVAPNHGRRVPPAGKMARRERGTVGLSGADAVAEDAGLLRGTSPRLSEAIRPRNRWRGWASARITLRMLRGDRPGRAERSLRDWASRRAFDFWEGDQRVAAAGLAEELGGRDPARVVAQLRQTPAGVDWLAARWRALAGLDPAGWTDAHREHAARLLGGDASVDPSASGFAAARAAELEADRPRVEEADALLRGLVESDLTVADLGRLRRQVREWLRQIRWCLD